MSSRLGGKSELELTRLMQNDACNSITYDGPISTDKEIYTLYK